MVVVVAPRAAAAVVGPLVEALVGAVAAAAGPLVGVVGWLRAMVVLAVVAAVVVCEALQGEVLLDIPCAHAGNKRLFWGRSNDQRSHYCN